MLTAKEIRRRYLEFFHRRQHEVVESGPIIPPNDPTLLFANAGMVQFKKCFLGEEKRGYSRAATCQKCLRVSGKHNDLENVGRTARHHTFFEMLGNFSFGDYFKREAITWAWQFVTEELELPKDKLWVTVFREDDEAAAIWAEVAGLAPERIVRMGEKDNFWTMGDTGPCGPCSEIYIDQGEDMACGPDCGIGKCDCDRFLEIWNLVFTQYDQAADGSRTLLAHPNIDTGMGLERMAAVAQGKRSNFDCDLFQDIIQYAAGLAGATYSFSAPDTNDVDTALRVIADHARAAAFLIAGGVLPSNESRGYVLRRLIRRALRFATLMGVHEPFLHKVARKVTEVMGEAYPELTEHADFIDRAVHEEEQRFSLTLQKGLDLLEEELASLKAAGTAVIPGDFCFRLYDTYGFPLDIVTDVAEKRGFTADAAGFERHMAEQRRRAREHQKKGGLLGQAGDGADPFRPLREAGLSTTFTGYERLTEKSVVTALLNADGEPTDYLGEEERGFLVTAATPVYGESGGQAGVAESPGVKLVGGKGHAGHTQQRHSVQGDHQKFTHETLLGRLYCWVASDHSPQNCAASSGLVFRPVEGALDVEHGEHEEHEGLHGLAQQEQGIDGQGAQQRRHDEEEDHDDFLAADVAEETERKRERPGKVRNNFQREHQRDERLGRAGELVDVMGFPAGNAHHVVQHEDEERHADRGVQVGCGRVETGDQPHEVHAEDVNEDAGQQGDKFAPLLAHGGDDEIFDGVNERLEKVLQAARH